MSAPADLLHIQQLLLAGRWREAKPLLERLAQREPPPPGVLHQLAELELNNGDPAVALRHLARLDAATDNEAAFLLARVERALGQPRKARDRLIQLRARLPRSTAPLEIELGSVMTEMGDRAGTIEALRAAVALRPELTAVQKNLAALLSVEGRYDEAREVLERALQASPHDGALWIRLSAVHSVAGDADAALKAAEDAVKSMSSSAEVWREIGFRYSDYWKYDEANRALDLASTLDRGELGTETRRAVVKQELGDVPGALEALRLAAERNPGNLTVFVSERLMLPQVYDDLQDVARWRQRYTDGLAQIEARMDHFLARAEEVLDIGRNNFLLAYQGEDDTDLQRRYSRIIARLLDRARPQWREGRPVRFRGERRLRVGFISAIFRDCTAGLYFERWITQLDPALFERYVYHTGSITDDVTRRIAASCERFITLRATTQETAERLYADDLDVLVQPEVGMSPLSYELAAMRLAPVQCAGWGHPVTTGSDAVDAYFTSAPMEPPDAASHYVEPLVLLPGMGVSYSMPGPPAETTRAELGLPERGRLYVCAQSLFKVHPEMDPLLVEISERDPEGVLVFFQAGGRRVSEHLAARLQRAFAARGIPPRSQLKFLGRMPRAHFRSVLAHADVVLDTVRWSGGNTSLDTFASGTPVVTLPGRFMRGRQTAGMLRLMEIPELIAASTSDYVRIAVEVARDRDLNRELRRRIVERRGVLFDQPAPIQAFSEALLRLAAARR